MTSNDDATPSPPPPHLQVENETPASFLEALQAAVSIDGKTLRFCYDRLQVLLRTLEITNTDDYMPIQLVADFGTLVGTYARGFAIIIEPYDERMPNVPDPVMQVCCCCFHGIRHRPLHLPPLLLLLLMVVMMKTVMMRMRMRMMGMIMMTMVMMVMVMMVMVDDDGDDDDGDGDGDDDDDEEEEEEEEDGDGDDDNDDDDGTVCLILINLRTTSSSSIMIAPVAWVLITRPRAYSSRVWTRVWQ